MSEANNLTTFRLLCAAGAGLTLAALVGLAGWNYFTAKKEHKKCIKENSDCEDEEYMEEGED